MKKIMAANWKMNKLRCQAKESILDLVQRIGDMPSDRIMVVFPPFTAISEVHQGLFGHPGMFVGAQNFYPATSGAFTGEVCPEMLVDTGCSFALAGHSERRHVLGESDEFIARKVRFGLESSLRMILCVGELLEERKEGQVEKVLDRQLSQVVGDHLEGMNFESLTIAYEPVWAIGTGEVAGPKEIVEAHTFIRQRLVRLLPSCGQDIPILYGGSVKPENCAEIINLDNVNGVLVGGASLSAESFSRIVQAGN